MSNKKGKLSKSELYYIQQNPDNLSAGDMAKELKRPIQVVTKTIVKFKQNPETKKKKRVVEVQDIVEEVVQQEVNVETVEPHKEPTMLSKLFGHDDPDKEKRRGYAIMTQAAAEQSDVLKKADKQHKLNQEHIFKPMPGKPSR